MPFDELVKNGTQIAFMFGSIAVIALLVSQSQGFSTDVKAAGGVFNGLLQTVTLQNNTGNVFSG